MRCIFSSGKRNWPAPVLALVLLFTCPLANATEALSKDEQLALLPEYCRHTPGYINTHGTREGAEHWSRLIGPAFGTMQHHCYGLLQLHNATRARNSTERRFHYRSAAGEFEYVISRVNDDFVLLPELLTRQSDALWRISEHARAEEGYRRAIRVKPDYWPAYAGLAQSMIAQKRIPEARQVLDDGISKVSDPRGLRRIMNELDASK